MQIDAARRYLSEEVDRPDLALLLKYVEYDLRDDGDFSWVKSLVLYAPSPIDEAVRGLSDVDRGHICKALTTTDDEVAAGVQGHTFKVAVDRNRQLEQGERLFPDVIIHRNVMRQRSAVLSVGTGGARIQDVDDSYKARQKRLTKQLAAVRIEYTNAYASLWDWYHDPDRWEAHSYASRRKAVRDFFDPVISALCTKAIEPLPVPAREPTGWELVDRQLEKAREQFDRAMAPEDYQSVGLLCREVIISLGQQVFEPRLHESLDGKKPSDTDAKRMLDAYLHVEVVGSSNDELRAHARASYNLAVALQHRRTADFRSAALCLEATSSTVNVVAIVAGRRDRTI